MSHKCLPCFVKLNLKILFLRIEKKNVFRLGRELIQATTKHQALKVESGNLGIKKKTRTLPQTQGF